MFFCHISSVELIQTQQYCEKQVTLPGGHIQEGEGEKMKLRRLTWLMCSLYKNEYRIYQSVEITIRRD
jgi:hypothetical protein